MSKHRRAAEFTGHGARWLRLLLAVALLLSFSAAGAPRPVQADPASDPGAGGASMSPLADEVCTTVHLVAVADTYMNGAQNSQTRNYGNETTVRQTVPRSQVASEGGLYKWNLSSIPAGARVDSASLTFRVTAGSSRVFNLYRVRKNWTEGGATWRTYNGTTSWSSNGAAGTTGFTPDRDSTSMWTVQASAFNATGVQEFTLNATGRGVLEDWINNSSTNYGVTIQNYTSVTGTQSSNWTVQSRTGSGGGPGVPSTPPTLNVTYCVPAEYGVTLTPAAAAQSGDSGDTVTYTLTVRNTGDVEDTFTLALGDSDWDATLSISPPSVTLAANATAVVQVSVDIPANALAGAEDEVAVTATSQGDTTKSASATLTTSANTVYGVTLTADTNTQTDNIGTTVAYTLTVTNTGNDEDTFDLALGGGTWTTTLSAASLTLDAGDSDTVTVEVEIPDDAWGGTSDAVTVTATSQSDGTKSANVTLTTVVSQYAVMLTPDFHTLTGDPGGAAAVYNLTVTNNGNVADTFELELGTSAWGATLSDDEITLDAGASATVQVSVAVPAGVAGGATDSVEVTARSQGSSGRETTSVTLTTRARKVYGVTLEAVEGVVELSDNPGETVTYMLTVTNTGNTADTFKVAVSGNVWTVSTATTVGLDAGESLLHTVKVTIPAGALAGASDAVTVTVTSDNDDDATDSVTLTTSANTVYGVEVAADNNNLTGDAGDTMTYTLTVTNTGNAEDTFTLGSEDDRWPTWVSPLSVTLDVGASAEVTVEVKIPDDALGGDKDTVTVTAMSPSSVSDSVDLTTRVRTAREVELTAAAAAQSGDPGVTVVYNLTVTNAGNIVDTFDLDLSVSTWTTWWMMTPAQVTVGPGATAAVTVSVTIPADALAGASGAATVTATSRSDATVSDSITLTTSANAVYGVQVEAADVALSDYAGETVSYVVTVTNLGNAEDTFDLDLSGATWTTDQSRTSMVLAAGASDTVTVEVEIPGDARGDDSDTVTLTATSQGDDNISAGVELTTTTEYFWLYLYIPSVSRR